MISYQPFYKTLLRENITEYALIFKHGIPANTLHRMKHGKPITTTTLDTLCSILNCSVSDILEYIPPEKIQCWKTEVSYLFSNAIFFIIKRTGDLIPVPLFSVLINNGYAINNSCSIVEKFVQLFWILIQFDSILSCQKCFHHVLDFAPKMSCSVPVFVQSIFFNNFL